MGIGTVILICIGILLVYRKFAPGDFRFVRVIFNKDDKKQYEYILGDNYDVDVGDFVEVHRRSKFSGRNEIKIAQVVYISGTGETSNKAKSTVIGKVDKKDW